ncbi:MAG: hypothetical protein WCT18_00200 [Patescibacteria group bacterium]
MDQENFKKIKNAARINYEMVGRIYCPALKSDIRFNSDGFHHLCYDGHRSQRDKQVQQNKFRFLSDAVCVLKKATTIQEYRRFLCQVGECDKNGFYKTKIIEWFGFYAIISFSKAIRINVVVRRIGEDSGNFCFWSVMPYWSVNNKKRIIGSKKMEDE